MGSVSWPDFNFDYIRRIRSTVAMINILFAAIIVFGMHNARAADESQVAPRPELQKTTPAQSSQTDDEEVKEEPPPPKKHVEHKDRPKAFGKIYYDTGGVIRGQNVSITAGGPYSLVTSEFNSTGAFGIGAEFFWARIHNWGFDAGLDLDFNRTIGNSNVQTGGAPLINTPLDNTSKWGTGDLYGNFMYRWDQFYIPFGLNISYLNLNQGPNSSVTNNLAGGYGVQLGVGWLFENNLSIELIDRVLSYSGTFTSSNLSGNYGYLYMQSFHINLKYGFDLNF